MDQLTTYHSTSVNASTDPDDTGAHSRASILAAIAYADLFDFPLTLPEIYRYQVGTAFTERQLARALEEDLSLRELVSMRSGYCCLRGREQTLAVRARRRAASARPWKRAYLWARLVSRVPFVRMVAVSGALAVDNIGEVPDIDLLIVARSGRVWICRRLLVLLVRFARLFGDKLCPNYIVAGDHLTFSQRDFYTAQEIAQMVPLSGSDVYEKMLDANLWALDYLPRAFQRTGKASGRTGRGRHIVERLLASARLDAWEHWEMARMRAKLSASLGETAEVVCSPTECKGHTGLHRQWVMARYSDALARLQLQSEVFLPETPV